MSHKGTFIDLEFDTSGGRGAPLGDIASSLVSVDDLLRDLGTIAAYPSSVEFREVRVVAIELRNPLKVTLSLFAIPDDAVKGFQEICRDIIVFRQRGPHHAGPDIIATLNRVITAIGKAGQVTDREVHRFSGHVLSLQNAEVALKRVSVRAE